ncbi:MAG: hypothetical protein WCK08_20530 [Betaproteobacteria bacterium]
MHLSTQAHSSSEDLSVWVERGLALRPGPVEPAEVQRQLKHLRRLEPSASVAVAHAGLAARADAPPQDFGACLRELS